MQWRPAEIDIEGGTIPRLDDDTGLSRTPWNCYYPLYVSISYTIGVEEGTNLLNTRFRGRPLVQRRFGESGANNR